MLGNHQFKFGGQYYHINDNRTFGAYENAVETLGSNTSGAIANLIAGKLLSFQTAIDPQGRFPGQTITLPAGSPQFGRNNRYDEFALYGMDSFKIRSSLTLNLGLRYEYYGPQANSDPTKDSNFYFGGNGTWTAANVRSGGVSIAPSSSVGHLWKADTNNFAPSVGFAWDIEKNGRSALRGGYALRYERNFGNVTFNVIQNPPNYAVVQLTGTTASPIFITNNNAGPFSGTGTVPLFATSLRAVDPHIRNAYAHQYSLTYERRIGSFLASASFSGSAGRDLYSIANINRQGSGLALLGSNDTTRTCSPTNTAGSTATTSVRLNCQFGDINYRGNEGRSNYNGLTLSIESGNLFKSGVTLLSRYTYSVTKDNLSTTFSETGSAFNLGYLDAYNPNLDYGNADFDVRNRSITSVVWDLPNIYKSGLGKRLLGGFTLAGIFNIQGGSPFSVYDCTNGITTCTRLIPNGSISYTSSGLTNVGTNTWAFIPLAGQVTVPLPATATNINPGENGFLPANMTARNAFRGPGYWNVDLSASKKFYVTERINIQIRADAQNAFNRANLFANVGSADVSGFDNSSPGTTASATNPIVTASRSGRRQFQFGIRVSF
jgi:hypothetical protein